MTLVVGTKYYNRYLESENISQNAQEQNKWMSQDVNAKTSEEQRQYICATRQNATVITCIIP